MTQSFKFHNYTVPIYTGDNYSESFKITVIKGVGYIPLTAITETLGVIIKTKKDL